MPAQPDNQSASEAESRTAAAWAVRSDRGLTAAEQDEYLQWLCESPDCAALLAEHETTLRRMRQLSSWQPASSTAPNPDLFAPKRRWRALVVPFAAAAAIAAALALGYFGAWRDRIPASSHLVVNEQRTLPDGSKVEFKNGTAIDIRYTPDERRIALMGGEAVFTVTKNPARPFIVDAAGVAVRAVGTAFDVRIESGSVGVLVTQGRVEVKKASRDDVVPSDAPVFVSAGERAVVPLSAWAHGPQVASVTSDEVSADLAWRAPHFEFYETPLGEAVAEFNRYNARQLQITDPQLRSVPIGGTFRADDVAGFAHILEGVMDVHATADGSGGFVLTRVK